MLEDGVHELRVKLSGNQIRVLYFFCYRDFIVLTNVYRKNTAKVPESEIRKAKRCRADFLARFDEEKLRELVQ
ncbi:MAG: type II toxin-antitoxin system RelE/ParE family toxin [Syntrophobacteraceae bacterium]